MIGQLLQNRYRVDAGLGQGGMGSLYRAHDLVLERDVAIKMLNDPGLGTEGRARLLREAQASARLDHPNIVAIYDVGEADGQPFIVMQYIQGQSLHELRPTDLSEIIAIIRQVCAALEHAHTHGIIHGDLKPENVLITADGIAKLSDFGLARSVASRITGEGKLIGTVFYMAPEQALGQAVDRRMDLYALGVMFYELAAGRLPFLADEPVAVISQHLYAPVVPPSTYNAEITPALDALILQLMSKRPSDRPDSAAEVIRVLDAGLIIIPAAPAAPVSSSGISVLDRIARGRLVGRQSELNQLHDLWAYVQQGNAHLALISGEPGIGKTRLANEILVYAQLNHTIVLRGGCYEYETTTPYMPFSEAIRDWVSRQETDTLRECVKSTAFELARLAPEIDARIGPLAPNPPLPSNEERLRMFDHVARFFHRLADTRGLLIFIDDLHWADNGTIALLHYLLRRLRNDRVFILAAYREVELDRWRPLADALVEWNRERLATRIAIGRLSPESCTAMLGALFGLESITAEFTQLIYQETEGNPFFIEEVVKSLIEQGQIYREGDRWQRREIQDLTIPQSVREAIGRRLNRLSPTCLAVLHTAAALGKTFNFAELAATSDASEDQLLDALDEASQAQLIRSNPDETFSFTHDKIREVLYEELNPIRRRRLHQRIGEGLAKLYSPADLPLHVQELAHHFIESGDLTNGLKFALLAAEKAERIYAHDEALYFYERAAECAETLKFTEQKIGIFEAIGDIYSLHGPYEKALEAYHQAAQESTSAEKQAELKTKIGATYANIGDEQGLRELREALDVLNPQTQVAQRARALAMLGRYLHYRGESAQAITYLENARQLVEPLDDVQTLTEIYAYLAGAYQWVGQRDVSDQWARQVITLGQSRNYPHAIALGYEFLAENAFNYGEWNKALTNAALDREIGEKIGSQERQAWAEVSFMYAYHGMGALKSALAAATAAALLAERIGNTRLTVISRSKRACIYSDLGQDQPAHDDLNYVIRQANQARQFQLYSWAYDSQAYDQMTHFDWDGLLQTAEQFEEYTNRQRNDWYFLAYMGMQRLDKMQEHLEYFSTPPDQTHSTLETGFLWRLYGFYQAVLGQYELAQGALQKSCDAFEKLGSQLELGRSLYWLARFYHRSGLTEVARNHFERARTILEACGAVHDLALVQAELKSPSAKVIGVEQ
jgi:eukaryotic-like serine/threonine-protein kinase